MADYRLGFLGANGITGGGIPVATGVGLSLKLSGRKEIAVCFFGDGASNQGTFHESLNMAAVWNLPVVYVCENNGYAMSTPLHEAFAIANIADRGAAYGLPGVVVDGNDLLQVRESIREACDRARSGHGATLVECKTYRQVGHSRGDQRKYRTREEEDVWRRRDPIPRFRKHLRDLGLLSDAEDRAIRAASRRVVADAIRFAKRSPEPDVARLEEGVFA